MAIKLKAKETLQRLGDYAGTYRYVLSTELYNKLSDSKVIQEAALRSGVSKGVMQACWDAAGEVIKAWATEGHSVAIPGLGTMRFGVRAKSVDSVDKVASSLITTRRVIFTPNSDIKAELKNTSINITCYDKDGNIIKSVTSDDDGDVEDEDTTTKHTLTLAANPVAGGTVTGAGEYTEGTNASISAVAASGYTFTKWSDGDTNATRTVTVNADTSLTAEFTGSGTPAAGDDDTI